MLDGAFPGDPGHLIFASAVDRGDGNRQSIDYVEKMVSKPIIEVDMLSDVEKMVELSIPCASDGVLVFFGFWPMLKNSICSYQLPLGGRASR